MKKALLFVILAAVLSAGAFAQHTQKGWGIGPGIQFGDSWSKDARWGTNGVGSGLALFLKAPSLPIFWSIYAPIFDYEFGDLTTFGLRVTGDYYIYDKPLAADIHLGWYLGVGGYAGFWHASYEYKYLNTNYSWSRNLFDLGVRVPVGLSFQPADFIEIFAEIAPSVGFYMWTGDGADSSGLGGGWQGALGVRFWL